MHSFRTSSLFHYTKNISTLKQILEEGIKPNYAKEVFCNGSLIVGIPMLSFCDIPVSLASDISEHYGKFAIGFTKEWGAKYHINPVLYNKGGRFDTAHEMMLQLSNRADCRLDEKIKNEKETGNTVKIPVKKELWENVLDQNNLWALKHIIFGFSKSYDCDYKGKKIECYSENEWRYVVSPNSEYKWLFGEAYEEWRGEKKSKPKSKFPPLTFSTDDITIVIVKNKEMLVKLFDIINKIKKIGGNTRIIEDDERKLLLTKIISLDCIENNF